MDDVEWLKRELARVQKRLDELASPGAVLLRAAQITLDGTLKVPTMATAGFVKNAVTTGALSGGNGIAAADLSDYIAPTTWTPTVTQTVGVTQFTATDAWYAKVGGLCTVHCLLTMTTGAAGTANSEIVIGGIPAAVSISNNNSDKAIGNVLIKDSGTAYYQAAVVPVSTTSVAFIRESGTDYVGHVPNFGLAVNDTISFTICYRHT